MRPFKIFGVTAAALLCALLYHGSVSEAQTNETSKAGNATLVYVGTGAKGKGIYLFRLQPQGSEVFQNVTLVPLGVAAETPNPTFLEIDLKRRLLFAVNEIDTGAVSAFSIDPAGKLTLLNQRPSMGARPCHLALDKESRNLLVTNCGGSVAVLPVGSDGRLGEAKEVVPHAGKSITLDPDNRFAFACDPASDKVLTYRFDAQQGKLSPAEPTSTPIKAAAGPRQLVFRPDGRFAYVVNERNSTIAVFAYESKTGALSEVQIISTLPDYFDGTNTAAEAGIHRSGKYLYVSNQGHNSVVLFGIDPEKGTLTYVEEQGTGGIKPRHFGIQPSGQHLAIANHDSDTVLASRIDAGNGRLKPSGIFAEVPAPAFVKFLPPPESGR